MRDMSLDTINIILEVEETFGIKIKDEECGNNRKAYMQEFAG